MQTVWIKINQLVYQDKLSLSRSFAIFHNLVDEREICMHLLKIASAGNFYLLLE